MTEVRTVPGAGPTGDGRSSRGTVGAALRVLMTRHGVGVDDAFELLVRASRRSHVELKEIAVGVVHADRRTPRCRLDRPFSAPVRRLGHCSATRPTTPTR